MIRSAPILLAVVASGGSGVWANTYWVRNTQDSGANSLRWAIQQASIHAGRDKIAFAPSMNGKVIRVLTNLPVIMDRRTIIDADIDDDGAPDVALNGKLLGAGNGLEIAADYCTIGGLAITNFPGYAILVNGHHHTTIRSCHIGVNLPGTKAVPNGSGEIILENADYNTIGGTSPTDGNVIEATAGDDGILLRDSSYNVICGNYIGVKRNGMEVLGDGRTGVRIRKNLGPCKRNRIGGATPAERNIFGGLKTGVNIDGASLNKIVGNYFGLAQDGSTGLEIATEGVLIGGGAKSNTVGGTTADTRNVFAGDADYGVLVTEPNTEGTTVQGNYFGTNAAGTRQRRLDCGVCISGGAKAQVVGGDTLSAGNYFAVKGYCHKTGVRLWQSGDGTVIRHNSFGILPNGKNVSAQLHNGVRCEDARAAIVDNTFAACGSGVRVEEAGANPLISANVFRQCATAVSIINNARCRLGDLSNSSALDDGGNRFRKSNVMHIVNDTPYRVSAEGNGFGTTSRSEINPRIYDRRDNPALGRVDYSPLIGGVVPTGESCPLVVAGAVGMPAEAGGAEIAFSLSAPADVTVTVLNIAGRSVAAVLRDHAANAGLQRIAWSGQSAHGTRVPNGRYLARIVARDQDGQQAQVICPLRLER